MLRLTLMLCSSLLAISLLFTGSSAQSVDASAAASLRFDSTRCPQVPMERRAPCGDQINARSKSACPENRCCFNETGSPRCYTNIYLRSIPTAMRFVSTSERSLQITKPRAVDVRSLTSRAARISGDLGITGASRSAITGRTSSVNRNFLALAINFPQCAVNVPMCCRVRCNAGNPLAETNPLQCLSDPTCCFDRNLLLYRLIFGPAFMGGAPVCYYGPTSPRYQQLARLVQPYNPFFQTIIVNLFQEYFDTALNFRERAVCAATDILSPIATLCGCPGITKLGCHLKGCCYSDRNRRCSYPINFLNLQSNFFPELTSPSNVQTCPNSFFSPLTSFSPSIYQRLPCAQANSAVELLTACQVRRGCCFDATAALIPQFYGFTSATAGLGSFAALSLLGGNPGNLALQFFCPYITISLPGFPDLTNSVRGCCEVKACYHRTGSGFVPTVNPPFPPIPPVQNCQWTQWSRSGACSNRCGQNGQQSRQRRCLFRNSNSPCSSCPGSANDFVSCPRRNCASWSQWTQFGSCSAPCGQRGERTSTRRCAFPCQGEETRRIACQGASCCQWSSWRPTGSCNAQCGQRGTQQRTRSCRTSFSGPCNSCPGRSRDTQVCNGPPCYGLGPWTPWSFCGNNCRRERRRYCVSGDSNRRSDVNLCGRSARTEDTERCSGGGCLRPPNTPWVSWGRWMSWSSCDLGCGGGTRYRERVCLYRGRPDSPLPPSICECAFGRSGIGARQNENCNPLACF